MTRFSCFMLAAIGACHAAGSAATPAYAPVVDDPSLPRVLLIGDSVSVGYTLPVRAMLRGVANVHRPPADCASSKRGVLELGKWLGGARWDVIHFNFGLHDAFVESGKHPVPIDEYEHNLRQIVTRLKKTGARLIWASTTPIAHDILLRPRGQQPVRDFYEKDVVEYNRVARLVMEQNGVTIDDLYALVLPRVAALQRPADIQFTPEGSQELARQVATTIRLALAAREAAR